MQNAQKLQLRNGAAAEPLLEVVRYHYNRGKTARVATEEGTMQEMQEEGFGNQYLEAVALGKGVVVCHEYPVMEADILPLISPDGIVSLGNNGQYTLDESGLVRLQADVLQAAVDREVHFLLHPQEE